MKTLIFAAAAALVLTSFSERRMHAEVYTVDTKQSVLEWTGEKLTGKHNGTIRLSEGKIENHHGTLSGTFEVDMTTIENKDLQGNPKAKLENHLKSADFFDVEKFPKARFVTRSITPLKQPKEGVSHKVTGMLTIKDKTNEVSFDALILTADNKITCSGAAVVDRSKFDVKYGSKSFFPNIGDKVIYDDFTLKFNIVALK
jgi:polyisoprenoid-binding protein YceI